MIEATNRATVAVVIDNRLLAWSETVTAVVSTTRTRPRAIPGIGTSLCPGVYRQTAAIAASPSLRFGFTDYGTKGFRSDQDLLVSGTNLRY